jgi:hypothetical protein
VRAYGAATALLALVLAGLGVAMTVVAAVGGGGLGLVLGPLFVALGAGRLYLLRAAASGRGGSEADTSDSDGG